MRTPIMESALRRLPRLVSPYARQQALRSHRYPSSRAYASVSDLSHLPQPGAKLHGYTLRSTKHVPELELSALLFQHDRTGAEHLHLARDDTNNVFCIGFKTNPPDATGVPHILEHVTLCGSEKYPVRDPFFKMLPRSLNNFMNAFTTTDHTMYPIATTNKKDFRNLVSMYLDSTLHPLLKRSDFLQEGWRVGPEDPHSTAGDDLLFKGVVYNEMKGQFSDATYLYYMRWLQDIYPSLNFYGGDPQSIPDLSWQQLRDFHKKNYHPSNSKILTYGDTPVDEHLSLIGPELDRFARATADTDLKLPKHISSDGNEVVVNGPLDSMLPPDSQVRTSLTWLMSPTNDIHETFALRVATTLLLDGYGSPLYQALIESGLGTDYSPNTGLDNSSARGIFAVGVNGVADGNVANVKPVILETIQRCIEKGFDDQKIVGLLHQLELGLKHKTAAFGLDLINRLTPSWFNGIDPLDALEWNTVVETFKSRYAQGGYLQGLLKKYLIDQGCTTYTMRPDPAFSTDRVATETANLQARIDSEVSKHGSKESATAHLQQQELELVEEQTSGQAQSMDCLPTLHVEDIPRQQPKIVLDESELPSGNQSVRLLSRITHTNGLTYVRAIVPMTFDDSVRLLLPLFTDCLTRLGTQDKSIGEFEDLIKLKTAGISFSYHAAPQSDDASKAEEGLLISSYSLDNNFAALLDLTSTLLLKTDFSSTQARLIIKQLLQANASGAVDAVAASGHVYSLQHAEASLSAHGLMSEQTSGLSQVETVSQLAALDPDSDDMSSVVSKLAALQSTVASSLQSSARIALICSDEAFDKQRTSLGNFVNGMQQAQTFDKHDSGLPVSLSAPTNGLTFFDLPFQVYYSGLTLPSFGYNDPRSASLAVLAQLLTHKHLHHEIREKGGAYGAGARSVGIKGMFSMFSYRDPNPENTTRIMREAGQWALRKQWSDQELEEAKLSLFQAIDAPRAVSDEGMVEFVTGIKHEAEQHRREMLLDVSHEQVKESAAWLNEALQAEKYNLVVLGPKKESLTGDWHVRRLSQV